MDLKQSGSEAGRWSHMAQDRHQWRALVNMVMHFRFPQKTGVFLD